VDHPKTCKQILSRKTEKARGKYNAMKMAQYSSNGIVGGIQINEVRGL